jgi:hypothetical protein
LIGYESTHATIATAGWSESLDKEQIEELEEKGLEVMQGWDQKFWEIEREAERQGWAKVCYLIHVQWK